MTDRMSARRVVMDTLRQLWGDVRGGTYHVKRGPIYWPAWEFKNKPLAVAILADEIAPFKQMIPADLSFEIGAAMPEVESEIMIDDGILDEIVDDVEWVFRQLAQARDSKGDNVVLKADFDGSTVQEWHDPELRVQGVVARLSVDF